MKRLKKLFDRSKTIKSRMILKSIFAGFFVMYAVSCSNEEFAESESEVQDTSIQDTAISVKTITAGEIYKIKGVQSDKYLEVSAYSHQNGANIQIWSDNNAASQQWEVLSVGDGIFRFKNVESGKCLDVERYSTENGGNIHQWEYRGTTNQQWTLVDDGSGIYGIINVNSGKGLDVENRSSTDGANVQQWNYYGTTNQSWVFEEVDDNVSTGSGTPMEAFDEFNPDSVTISFDGDDITIESTGLPNHTSPYWEDTNPLYIEPVVATRLTPGRIGGDRSYVLTVSAEPEIAASSTATGLGPIGISVSGVPIFNDQEGNNRPIEEMIVETFDYAGAHNGPSGYHYHVESSDVPENTVLSNNDEKLVGIMADGFLLYGRKCNSVGDYPTDLDASGGHISSTQHGDHEFYHYHIINEIYIGSSIVLFGQDYQGTPSSLM
ncbi:RICIN domain-containing protein [Aquimarina pacifica]|uniref:RICIN domain-containing protein n=1 Tax=Aquimarina pacifica TaxID=1296415 RepID=UPI00046F8455|nr:RICIN domain-containing protein [Aquimarina pacifica]